MIGQQEAGRGPDYEPLRRLARRLKIARAIPGRVFVAEIWEVHEEILPAPSTQMLSHSINDSKARLQYATKYRARRVRNKCAAQIANVNRPAQFVNHPMR